MELRDDSLVTGIDGLLMEMKDRWLPFCLIWTLGVLKSSSSLTGPFREEYHHSFSLNKYFLNARYINDEEPGTGHVMINNTVLFV